MFSMLSFAPSTAAAGLGLLHEQVWLKRLAAGWCVQVDAAVVEVGLGGVRDATNVLPAASLATAVIAAVGHDHAAALGGSIESIAAAKAGIMQAGRPVVLARQPDAAAEAVLLQRGEQLLLCSCCCCASALNFCLSMFVWGRIMSGRTLQQQSSHLRCCACAAQELDCPVIHAPQEVEFAAAKAAAASSSSGSSGSSDSLLQLLRQRRRMVLRGQTAAAFVGSGSPVELGEHLGCWQHLSGLCSAASLDQLLPCPPALVCPAAHPTHPPRLQTCACACWAPTSWTMRRRQWRRRPACGGTAWTASTCGPWRLGWRPRRCLAGSRCASLQRMPRRRQRRPRGLRRAAAAAVTAAAARRGPGWCWMERTRPSRRRRWQARCGRPSPPRRWL